jgi:hypothetical protein
VCDILYSTWGFGTTLFGETPYRNGGSREGDERWEMNLLGSPFPMVSFAGCDDPFVGVAGLASFVASFGLCAC